jgi:hypothetical protein
MSSTGYWRRYAEARGREGARARGREGARARGREGARARSGLPIGGVIASAAMQPSASTVVHLDCFAALATTPVGCTARLDRSGFEEGRAPARPLLMSDPGKAAPQRGALHGGHPHSRLPCSCRQNKESITYDMGSWRAVCIGSTLPIGHEPASTWRGPGLLHGVATAGASLVMAGSSFNAENAEGGGERRVKPAQDCSAFLRVLSAFPSRSLRSASGHGPRRQRIFAQ